MEPYQLVDTPSLLPHKCFLCETDTGRMVDTLINRPMVGEVWRVYLCANVCAPAVCHTLGWTSPADDGRLRDALAGLDERNQQLHDELMEARDLSLMNLSREEADLVRAHRVEKRELAQVAAFRDGALAELAKDAS